MKKLLVAIIILLTAILMTQTVPSKKEHIKVIMENVKEYVSKETESILGDNILSDLGKVLASNSIKLTLDSKLKVHDCYLFNYTTMYFDDKEQLLSVGLLGHIFTIDKDEIREWQNNSRENRDSNDEE